MSSAPLLHIKLAADRQLNPAAVVLELGPGDLDDLPALIADERFSAFAAACPCLLGTELAARLPVDLLDAMHASGYRTLSAGMAHEAHGSDATTRPLLPPAAHWLTGDWYLAAPARSSAGQAASRALSLKLMQRVAADADTCEIEAIFRQDPVLAYHLLRLVNSLGGGVGRPVSSFSQAILILGRQQLKRWLNLMLFAASRDDYRSAMLLARAAVRARSMELLAKAGGFDRAAQELAFMTGMFSLLGILFGLPLTDVLQPLKLNDALTAAVLRHAGDLGLLLRLVECGEHANEAELTARLGGLNLSTANYNLLNIEAHQWMLGVTQDKRKAGDV
jgi:EAL and modified HD-GYP domain-containing signal transduction protein